MSSETTDKLMGNTPELRRMYLKQRQSLPLSVKIQLSKRRIREWYEAHDGMVYVAFSGGKDSTALLHLVRSMYPEVPAVFADTGLEFPEIREFVKTHDNVEWVKPKKTFKQVLEEYGYPVVSKQVAMGISRYRNTKDARVRDYRLNGRVVDGKKYNSGTIPKKWQYLVDTPFKISEACCNYIKKNPMKAYTKHTKRVPYVGTMAEDSKLREDAYIKSGCNSFAAGSSTPMAFWLEKDVWEYIKTYNVPYAKIYDMGERRTGCIFCMFGCANDKERFVRLKKSHPQLHRYCMDKLGLKEVLEYMNLPTGDES